MTDVEVTEVAVEVPEEQTSGVSEDMRKAAAADLAELNARRAEGETVRTFSRGGVASQLTVSDIFSFPEDFDLGGVAPVSYLAQPEGEITGNLETQRFTIVEERLKGLLFDVPGRALERGRSLRVVKWLKPNGVLAQIPFEPQINNTAAGDLSDAIGVRKQERKGGVVFYDFEAQMPVYCFARNCWAAAMVPELEKMYPEHRNVMGSGYCSREHFLFVEPGRARAWFNEGGGGMFDSNATTSRNARR